MSARCPARALGLAALALLAARCARPTPGGCRRRASRRCRRSSPAASPPRRRARARRCATPWSASGTVLAQASELARGAERRRCAPRSAHSPTTRSASASGRSRGGARRAGPGDAARARAGPRIAVPVEHAWRIEALVAGRPAPPCRRPASRSRAARTAGRGGIDARGRRTTRARRRYARGSGPWARRASCRVAAPASRARSRRRQRRDLGSASSSQPPAGFMAAASASEETPTDRIRHTRA